MTFSILHGDCLDIIKTMDDNSIDSVVTDPPYGISFMNRKWDYDVPSVDIWKEVLRVMKPGAHALVACGTRTQHRMAVNLEDAGFEIRDCIVYAYGSGFPKSLNLGKAYDKFCGNEREVFGEKTTPDGVPYSKISPNSVGKYNESCAHNSMCGRTKHDISLTKGQTEWEGWGTALKPAVELWTLCRKPLSEKTIIENVIKHGTGGINVDGCRVKTEDNLNGGCYSSGERPNQFFNGGLLRKQREEFIQPTGRFPANLILDGSDEVVSLFPMTSKSISSKRGSDRNGNVYGAYGECDTVRGHDDNGGSASRFFYCAKASKSERNKGVEGLSTWECEALSQELMDLKKLLRDISEDTIRDIKDTEWNTILFGKNIMDQYQSDTISIISIISNTIIELKTLVLSQKLNTREYILDVIRMIPSNGLNLAKSVEHISLLKQNITNEKMGYLLGVVCAVLKTLLRIKEKERLGNIHSTVKPVALMKYLCRLITPKNGVVLDPFCGSGSTGVAAKEEGFNFIGIEREKEYVEIANARIQYEKNLNKQMCFESMAA